MTVIEIYHTWDKIQREYIVADIHSWIAALGPIARAKTMGEYDVTVNQNIAFGWRHRLANIINDTSLIDMTTTWLEMN